MITNSSWGVYNISYQYSVALFADKDPLIMAEKSQIHFDVNRSLFFLTSLGQDIAVSYPEGRVFFTKTNEMPIFSWSFCILNSLIRSDGASLTGRLISYRELEDGYVYYPAFKREAIGKLATWLKDKSIPLLERIFHELGGLPNSKADLSSTLSFLPCFPLTVNLWLPDDEIDSSVNILFDSSANNYLHTEDAAAIGEMISRFLISHYTLLSY
ncbi:MAG: DUF3786 domain-containing protein [Peptococcaceae bacterium]|nr:DUF3786 domain-containing protein [Peptococcaceae bacterium]